MTDNQYSYSNYQLDRFSSPQYEAFEMFRVASPTITNPSNVRICGTTAMHTLAARFVEMLLELKEVASNKDMAP